MIALGLINFMGIISMKTKLRCFLTVLVALNLVGCGLKGPLYMPQERPAVEQLPAPVPETPVQQDTPAAE